MKPPLETMRPAELLAYRRALLVEMHLRAKRGLQRRGAVSAMRRAEETARAEQVPELFGKLHKLQYRMRNIDHGNN